MSANPGRSCRHWIAAAQRHCEATEDVRLYPIGLRCRAHTPAAVAGVPEASGQYCARGRCYCGREECPAYPTYRLAGAYASELDAYAAIDAPLIASGKRRSNPDAYATARATVTAQRERNAQLRKATPARPAGPPEPSGGEAAKESPLNTGNDLADTIRTTVVRNIRHAAANAPRSQQVAIGVSEYGDPCTRKIAYKLLDWDPKPNAGTDPWASAQGTAMHAWMEETYRAENQRLGWERYLIEQKVKVSEILSGHSDVFDREHGCVMDWKYSGSDRIKTYRSKGPGDTYRIQAHSYGYGQALAGEDVRHVAIVFLPRAVSLNGAYVWTEPYNPEIVTRALGRLEMIRTSIFALDPEAHPERWSAFPTADSACKWCPWYLPGSANLSEGCPGDPDAGTASIEDLIA